MEENYGFLRVVAASPEVRVADVEFNAGQTEKLAAEACLRYNPSVIVFPELGMTGYTCADLFGQQALIDAAERAVGQLAGRTAGLEALIAVGAPVRFRSRLYNCAILLRSGRILGIVPKAYLPGNDEFYEPRNFESGTVLGTSLQEIRYAGQQTSIGILQLFRIGDATLGVEVCQDLWVPIPPSTYACLSGAEVILNLSASNELAGKQDYRLEMLRFTTARQISAYVYSSCGAGESTSDLVWSGCSSIFENGACLSRAELFRDGGTLTVADIDIQSLQTARCKYVNYSRDGVLWADAWPHSGNGAEYRTVDCGPAVQTDFETELFREVDPHPFVPGGSGEARAARCREVFSMQVCGLKTRLRYIGSKCAVIGISGGLDSTLALLVTLEAFDLLGWDRKGIIAVTMPGFGTSDRTRSNARILMEKMGVTSLEISIAAACGQHFKDIGLDPSKQDTTYENAQARERTQILMDLAGKHGGIVVGTGDLSELALGWCTYNGDHMSMYAVNSDVPKTLVREIVAWRAGIEPDTATGKALLDIVDTPISPELVPGAQITEDLVGPYELHDFFLKSLFSSHSPSKTLFLARKAFAGKYDGQTVLKWLRVFTRRFFAQQFKRNCLPDGPKVGSVGLSPRGEWRMASDAHAGIWLKELE